MNATTTFENNLLDTITALVMAPITLIHWLVWLLWQGSNAVWPYRRYIALAIVAAPFVALCVACPALPLGLAIGEIFAGLAAESELIDDGVNLEPSFTPVTEVSPC